MKRHESLIPLTHDHHHALVQARRLWRSAEESADRRLAQAREFLDFFRNDTMAHFREEEQAILPLLAGEPKGAVTAERVIAEHLSIRARVEGLEGEVARGAVREDTVQAIGRRLKAHIRFEEKIVFPLIESLVPDETLAAVVLAPRTRSKDAALTELQR